MGELLINIKKAKDNYDKDRKPRYFDCNIYRYIIKDCKKPKKEKKLEIQQSRTSYKEL